MVLQIRAEFSSVAPEPIGPHAAGWTTPPRYVKRREMAASALAVPFSESRAVGGF